MGWADYMGDFEQQRTAQDRESVQNWNKPWSTPDRNAGQMQPTTDPGEYGLLSYIGDLLRQHNQSQAEMSQRGMQGAQQFTQGGGIDPQWNEDLTNQAMMMAMGTVGPSKFSPRELAMREGSKAGQLSRQAKMRWGDSSTGLEDALQDLIASQERGGTPTPIRPMRGLTNEQEFKGMSAPELRAFRDKVESKRMMRDVGREYPEETSRSALDRMFNESPAIRDTRLRNFILKEGGNSYQHPLPYPTSTAEATARGQVGYNPEAWYSPSSILDALGYGLKGGAQAVMEDSPAIQKVLASLPNLPQMPGRAKAFLSEHPVGVAAGAAGGAGYAFGPDMGQYSEGIAIPNTEASREQARKFETGLAKHAGTAPPVLPKAPRGMMQRAQEPWWGVTPEDILAAAEYFGSLTRDPFKNVVSR